MLNTFSDVSRLKVSEITVNPDVNIRELDFDYVAELMQSQLEYGEGVWQSQWKEKPKINQDGVLFSGFHTIAAVERNFGIDHEVYFEVAEGDSYLLAAGENATHGRRRTNTDKRAAVLRWLEDDEGKQWTDRYIGEQCHVSHPFVTKVSDELVTVTSYQRPTKRKYLKNGNLEWMETAKINAPDAPDADQAKLDLDIPSKEALDCLKQFQYKARGTLTQFADTLSADCEIINYSGFSQWGEGYIGHKINALNSESIDVREAIVKFSFSEFNVSHDMPDKDFWEEAYPIIGDVPENSFGNSVAELDKLTDISQDYFSKADPMYRVIVLLDRVLIARVDLEGLLRDFIDDEAKTLYESLPAYESWLKDYDFQQLLDASGMLGEALISLQSVVGRLNSFRKSKDQEIFDAFKGCKSAYVRKLMREYYRNEGTD